MLCTFSDGTCCKCACEAKGGGYMTASSRSILTRSADRQDTQDRGVQGAAAEEGRNTVDTALPMRAEVISKDGLQLFCHMFVTVRARIDGK